MSHTHTHTHEWHFREFRIQGSAYHDLTTPSDRVNMALFTYYMKCMRC